MSFPFDLRSAAVSDSHLPCHAHAVLLKTNAQHSCRETACGLPAHVGLLPATTRSSTKIVIRSISTTPTEAFPCFPSVVRQMPGLNSQSRDTDRISSELSFVLCLSLCYAIVFMLFCCYYVVLLLCCSVIICVILCIDRVYCTTVIGC